MSEKSLEAVQRHLRGERAKDIAAALGVSRARVYQLIQEARAQDLASAHIQVRDIRGVERQDLAAYLHRVLAAAGVNTHVPDVTARKE